MGWLAKKTTTTGKAVYRDPPAHGFRIQRLGTEK
jgi:hypothetical protein